MTALVVDASAIAEYLLWTPTGQTVAKRLAEADDLHAPHLVIIEVMSVLRGWVRGRDLSDARGQDSYG